MVSILRSNLRFKLYIFLYCLCSVFENIIFFKLNYMNYEAILLQSINTWRGMVILPFYGFDVTISWIYILYHMDWFIKTHPLPISFVILWPELEIMQLYFLLLYKFFYGICLYDHKILERIDQSILDQSSWQSIVDI